MRLKNNNIIKEVSKMDENKTTGHTKSKLKSAVGFLLKIVLALALILGIAAIGMQFFPQLTGMQEAIRHNWFNLLLWRLILYAKTTVQSRFSQIGSSSGYVGRSR